MNLAVLEQDRGSIRAHSRRVEAAATPASVPHSRHRSPFSSPRARSNSGCTAFVRACRSRSRIGSGGAVPKASAEEGREREFREDHEFFGRPRARSSSAISRPASPRAVRALGRPHLGAGEDQLAAHANKSLMSCRVPPKPRQTRRKPSAKPSPANIPPMPGTRQEELGGSAEQAERDAGRDRQHELRHAGGRRRGGSAGRDGRGGRFARRSSRRRAALVWATSRSAIECAAPVLAGHEAAGAGFRVHHRAVPDLRPAQPG